MAGWASEIVGPNHYAHAYTLKPQAEFPRLPAYPSGLSRSRPRLASPSISRAYHETLHATTMEAFSLAQKHPSSMPLPRDWPSESRSSWARQPPQDLIPNQSHPILRTQRGQTPHIKKVSPRCTVRISLIDSQTKNGMLLSVTQREVGNNPPSRAATSPQFPSRWPVVPPSCSPRSLDSGAAAMTRRDSRGSVAAGRKGYAPTASPRKPNWRWLES